MPKRFRDTEIWSDPWFQELSPVNKCLWSFICDQCDNAGVWKINKKLADFQIGARIDIDKFISEASGRIIKISEEKLAVVKFIEFQFGRSPSSKMLPNIKRALDTHNIEYSIDTVSGILDTVFKPRKYSIDTPKDKEEDKDMVVVMDLVGVKDKDRVSDLPKTWRDDYDIYLDAAQKEFEAADSDWQWISDKKKFYPGMSIRRSMQKMWDEFWGKQEGWIHKKKSKTDKIDWRSTIEKGLSMHCNQVKFGFKEQDDEAAIILSMIKEGKL